MASERPPHRQHPLPVRPEGGHDPVGDLAARPQRVRAVEERLLVLLPAPPVSRAPPCRRGPCPRSPPSAPATAGTPSRGRFQHDTGARVGRKLAPAAQTTAGPSSRRRQSERERGAGEGGKERASRVPDGGWHLQVLVVRRRRALHRDQQPHRLPADRGSLARPAAGHSPGRPRKEHTLNRGRYSAGRNWRPPRDKEHTLRPSAG